MKDSGFITATSFPTLVGLNIDWPYKIGESGALLSSLVQGDSRCSWVTVHAMCHQHLFE
jgi:hypothetical protein